jgi:hypothetical protein
VPEHNLLPWKAVTPAKPAMLSSRSPLVPLSPLANRDEPASWFYLAKVTTATNTVVIVHYYGCRENDLKRAKFYPGWHLPTQTHIELSPTKPAHHIRYTGVLELNALDTLFVARKLGLTQLSTLNSKSRRLLMPVRDDLFIY